MTLWSAIAVNVGVTYLMRAIPLVLVRRTIRNEWLRAFLHYTPYAVLTAITIPAVFAATSTWVSAVAGFGVAVLLALRGRGLLVVALAAAGTVWIVEMALTYG